MDCTVFTSGEGSSPWGTTYVGHHTAALDAKADGATRCSTTHLSVQCSTRTVMSPRLGRGTALPDAPLLTCANSPWRSSCRGKQNRLGCCRRQAGHAFPPQATAFGRGDPGAAQVCKVVALPSVADACSTNTSRSGSPPPDSIKDLCRAEWT